MIIIIFLSARAAPHMSWKSAPRGGCPVRPCPKPPGLGYSNSCSNSNSISCTPASCKLPTIHCNNFPPKSFLHNLETYSSYEYPIEKLQMSLCSTCTGEALEWNVCEGVWMTHTYISVFPFKLRSFSKSWKTFSLLVLWLNNTITRKKKWGPPKRPHLKGPGLVRL